MVLTPRHRRQVSRRHASPTGRMCHDPRGDGDKKARSPGERAISRKPLRAGLPDDFGATAVNTRAHFHTTHARTRLRVHRAPGIPHALFGRRILAKLGRIAPRGVKACPGLVRGLCEFLSFRGDAQHRTRNLEIPRCAIAHLRSGAHAPSRNDGSWLLRVARA